MRTESLSSLVRHSRFMVYAGAMASVLWACSFIFDDPAAQCETDGDCAGRGAAFAGTVCSPTKTCTPVTDATLCDTHQECVDRNGGKPFICRKPDRKCFPLTSVGEDGGAGRCDRILADGRDAVDDNALFIGAMLVRGAPFTAIGEQQSLAIELARREIKRTLGGLPSTTPNTPRRPLVFIVCDEIGDAPAAIRHLTEVVKVPAIIGPSASGSLTNAIGTEVPKGLFMLSPVSSTPSLAGLDRKGLAFSINPSEAIAASMMSLYTAQRLEQVLRTKGVLAAGEQMKLVILKRGDALGTATANIFLKELRYNDNKSVVENGDNFKLIDIGDPFDKVNNPNPETKYAQASIDIVAYKPHIILSAGSTEVPAQILSKVEDTWTESAYRPLVMAPFHNESPAMTALLDKYIATNTAGRYRTTQFGVPQSPVFQGFTLRYKSEFTEPNTPAPGQYAAQGYDAAMLIALAAAGSPSVVTGATIAAAFQKTQDTGQPFTTVSPDAIATMFNAISSGQSLQLEGASGPLVFDQPAGSRPTNVQLRCPKIGFDAGAPGFDAGATDGGADPYDGGNAVSGLGAAGPYYDIKTKQLIGNETGCIQP